MPARNWALVARRELRETRRDRTLYVDVLLLAALGAGLGRGHAVIGAVASVPPLPVYVNVLGTPLLALLAVLAAHDVLPLARSTGTARLALALPIARREFVLGVALGRAAVVALAGAAMLVAGAAVSAGLGGSVSPLVVLGAVPAVAAYAGAFAALAVALSAFTASSTRSLAATLAATVLHLTWDGLLGLAWSLVADGPLPWPLALARRLDLPGAYDATVRLVAGVDDGWFGPAVLAGWLVASLAVAVDRFDRVSL